MTDFFGYGVGAVYFMARRKEAQRTTPIERCQR